MPHKRRNPQKQDLIITTNPKSAFAEAIKSIKTNIQFSSIDTEFKTIMITSPAPGDGKSFISANLAAAFAQEDKSVLIIDADLRRGRQHQIFNIRPDATLGYSNLIMYTKRIGSDLVDYDRFIHHTTIDHVNLLPAGPVPPNPLELLSSTINQELLAKFRSAYDIIIIDSPPVLGLSDAIIMSKLADINLVTITNNRTKYEQLNQTKQAFKKANSKLNGVIINRVRTRGNTYSSYYTDKYYTKGYYDD